MSAGELTARDTVSGPWTFEHRLRWLASSVLGLGLIFAAYWGASGTGNDQRQVFWLNVCALGALVAGAGNGIYLLRGHRAIRLARQAIFLPPLPVDASAGAARRAAPVAGGRLVAVPGTIRFHRSECPLVIGKNFTAGVRDCYHAEGRLPCEVCRP
jgi:hypothetical protein